jgi:hypothetical protein
MPQVEREILIQQIGEHLAAAAEPATWEWDRQIFWFYYRHGMTTRAIAAIPGIGLTQRGGEHYPAPHQSRARSSGGMEIGAAGRKIVSNPVIGDVALWICPRLNI